MIRLLSVICGIVMVLGGTVAAQGPATQSAAQRRLQRLQRRLPADPQNPAATAVTFAPPVAPQEPAVQPARPPQTTPPLPASTPNPAAQTPENLPPPTPAVVTYQNGLLTVQATNSTLGGLLAAIRNKTGIQFEGLEGGAPERVAIAIGPAPESEVLTAILGGSGFDYVVLGRPDSPGIVQRVLLMPRGGPASAAAGAQPPRPANAPGEGDDEDTPDEQASGEPQDTPARPPLTQVQPQQQPQEQPKTPEQLMQQLIQMQQQRQQQLQQQQQQQQQPVPPQNQAPIKTPPIPQ